MLNSEAEDFDFEIHDPISLESDSDGSFEYILLEAQTGNSYSITVYNESDNNETTDATYTISATKPNRELAKMVDGDYFISFTLDGEETCTWDDIWYGEVDKGKDTWSYTDNYFAIINWGKGYIKQGDEQFNFTAVDQDKLEVKFTVSDSASGQEVADWKSGKPTVTYSGSVQLNYTLGLDTSGTFSGLKGSMEGSNNWNEDYSDGDRERETCTETATITGEVLF